MQGTSKKEQQIHVMSTAAVRGNVIRLDLGGINPADVTVRAVGASGILVQQGHLSADGTFLVRPTCPLDFASLPSPMATSARQLK